MKKRVTKIMILTLSMLIMLVGCNRKTEEEVFQETKAIAENTFSTVETIAPNRELEYFTLYLPHHIEIEEIDENNIILNDNDQTYIVFYNNFEDPSSELIYNIEQRDDALLLETFEDEWKFGFIQVLPGTEEEYKIQVGIGGVKVTTYTTKNKLPNNAEEMMKIALSIIR